MNPDLLKCFINKNFLAVFPHGWIGRPWDNIYTLEEVMSEQENISLILSGDIKVSLNKKSQLIFLKNSLVFLGTDINITYGGKSFIFKQGPITFMHEETQGNAELLDIHEKLVDFLKS